MSVNVENVGVELSVELGRRTVTLDEARAIQVGDSIQLDRLAGEPIDLFVNGRAFGQGEVVALDDSLALRLTRLIEWRAK